jgi:molybdopterin converting factor small subunit
VKIEVQLFATFAAFLPLEAQPAGTAIVEVSEGSTTDDVAAVLGIPLTIARATLVNGQEAGYDQPLVAGDVVTLFPPLAGGQAARTLRRTPRAISESISAPISKATPLR